MRRAKIVATLGPSSDSVETIRKLIAAGMNVARMNMSHGTHESHAKVIENIREASRKENQEVAILLDLQGPKIRVDKLKEPLQLKDGDTWVIGPTEFQKKYSKYKDCYIPTVYKDLVKDCKDGCRILFDDGLIVAEALEKDGDVYKIKVLVGGELKSNKGINLPDVVVSAPSLSEKDRDDLMFGLRHDVDYVALSFVKSADDIKSLKYDLHRLRKNIPIVAKIENPSAVDNIESIIEVTDVIMVARGDMGVELGNHLVPAIQKRIIELCNRVGVPVITATQMLESMITNSTPTRAEASDVANSIWDGTDAVMLSGETASGKYPVEAIQMMSKVVEEAEKRPKERPLLRNIDLGSVNSSVMVAASLIAEKTNAKRIVAVTQSGNSCLKIARFRPNTPVLGVTNDIQVIRKMSLYWGVFPYYLSGYDEQDEELEEKVIEQIKDKLSLHNGEKLVITRGDGKFFSKGRSNSVRVKIMKDNPKAIAGTDTLETVEFDKGQINLDIHSCASCQNCIAICPHDIWMVSDSDERQTTINKSKAANCELDLECVQVCPTGAIEIISKI